MNCDNSDKWLNAMKEELKSMEQNGVWDLVEFPKSCKKVGYKWVFKTKRDSYGNLERYKVKLVAKGFLRKMALTTKRHFHQSHEKIHLELSWRW